MSFRINPSLVKAAMEYSSNMLSVPEDAKLGKGDAKRWRERFIIESSTIDLLEDNDFTVVNIKVKVHPASPTTVNLGRVTTARFAFAFNAVEGTGHYTMTAINLGRLQAFLRALGYETPSTGWDLEDYFGPRAVESLVGLEYEATVTDKPDRQDPTIRRQEQGAFKGDGQ